MSRDIIDELADGFAGLAVKSDVTQEEDTLCSIILDEIINDVLAVKSEVPQEKDNSVYEFKLEQYYETIDVLIKNILTRPCKEVLTYDILDTEKSRKNKLLALKEKQRQMKVGEIWQEVIGNYHEFINLHVGHETGLDILSKTRRLAIELKNRTNTDNHSSKKSNFDKLSKFKKENPQYTCIYANINDNTEKKTLHGYNKTITHNGVEIEHQVGYQFLTLIFNENTEKIIEHVKNTIDKNT